MNDALQRWRPAPGAWDRAAAAHLLGRAGFGGTPAEVEAALASGFEATLAGLFEERAPDAALARGAEKLLAGGDIDVLAGLWMARILSGAAPLRERMTLVWHGHFATSWDKVSEVRMMNAQNELFRQHALGDFRVLLHAVARDPAMLRWLDGDDNVKGSPNENFARELMELFALGLGAYSESDVKESARAFTGWGTEGMSFALRPRRHDAGPKTVLGQTGNLDGDAVVDIVLAQPACSRWIARRLLTELALPEPPPDAVEALAQVLTDSGWSLRAAVEAILASELFFSPAARRARIAGPVELVARSVRQLGVRFSPRLAAAAAARMGQTLFRPPSVKGWEGGKAWIHVGAWIARQDFLSSLAADHLGRDGDARTDLTRVRERPASNAAAAEMALTQLLPGLEDERFAGIVRAAAEKCGTADDALRLCAALVMTSPEYQLV